MPCGFSFARRRFQAFGTYVLSVGDRIRPLTAADLMGYFLGYRGSRSIRAPMDTPISEKENAQTGRSAYRKIIERCDYQV